MITVPKLTKLKDAIKVLDDVSGDDEFPDATRLDVRELKTHATWVVGQIEKDRDKHKMRRKEAA